MWVKTASVNGHLAAGRSGIGIETVEPRRWTRGLLRNNKKWRDVNQSAVPDSSRVENLREQAHHARTGGRFISHGDVIRGEDSIIGYLISTCSVIDEKDATGNGGVAQPVADC